jgi:uncharacterized membrane protein
MAGQSRRGLPSGCLPIGDPGQRLLSSEGAENVSNNAKWVIVAICAVLGIVALIYAVIYLAVPIHSLPGFVPGKKAIAGHYHKRAFVSGVIGVILLAIAGYLGMSVRRSAATQATPASGQP